MLYLDTLNVEAYQVKIKELWAFYERIGLVHDGDVDVWKWKEQYELLEQMLKRQETMITAFDALLAVANAQWDWVVQGSTGDDAISARLLAALSHLSIQHPDWREWT